ncbi:MAG: response regulator transcription factor [Bacteroidaceae bacterium]|nr:response regulator transcription factor [Bacteroidaceae bacterium]
MKVLIIEDETAASENLIAMLQEIDNEIEVLKVLESVQQTVRWLSGNPAPDLIFMDIHLSDGSAFTLFQEMEVTAPIVFTTAYDQYALDAFKVNSVDYLLKPIKTSELERALNKFKRWTHNDVIDYLQRMMKMRPSGLSTNYTTSLIVPVNDRLVPVGMDDVACIYSTDRKTQIHLKSGQTLLYNRSLDSIIVGLDPHRFFRANKQYIVARDCVEDMVVWYDSRLLVRLPIELPEPLFVSKNKAAEFKNWMTTN